MFQSLTFCGQELATREQHQFFINNKMGVDVIIITDDNQTITVSNVSRIEWHVENGWLNLFSEHHKKSCKNSFSKALLFVKDVHISFATFISDEFVSVKTADFQTEENVLN